MESFYQLFDLKVVRDRFIDNNGSCKSPFCKPRPTLRCLCTCRWVASSWMECSKSCGSGRQKRRVKCMRLLRDDIDKSVKESFCEGSKPRRRRNCNMHDCPARWIPSAWSDVSTHKPSKNVH